MSTCGTCGRQIGEDFAFCPYCAAPAAPAPPAREQRKRVTILFCDVVGSTALGESVDPEALRTVLLRYFQRMKGIIESHGGTVEKFIGDAVMAVFGVPVVHEDDALRAVRAAAEMQAALPELGITARLGVNSGEVVMGTEERLATGDAVNVAARLEHAAGGGEVLLGEETLRLVKHAVEVDPVEPLPLKGKAKRVPAYRLIAVRNSTERRQLMAPMIGRERELRRVQDACAQAVDDRSCQLVTILGTAGVGKSRLGFEFVHGMERGRVVRARCLSYGEGISYWPVVEVLKGLDAMPADDYAASILQALLGERVMAVSSQEIAWAFRVLLEEVAQEEPLVVVFDDIQWGEETFLNLIEHVADLSRDAPILLLCLARPELLEKRPGWGGGKENATTVVLEPLNADETDRLLEALGDVSEALRERIRVAAEGNPLFVEEMLALVRESGTEEVVVPPSIHALLAARLDQLAPDERRILECGSVEGRTFHRSAVQALSDDASDLESKLIGLVRKELVRPERAQLREDEAYRFRHLLIRDVAYEGLAKAVRAELHERFADWLEVRGTELVELDEIAGYHLEQAARYKQELGVPAARLAERAGERLAKAGRGAMWRDDGRAARGLLERALHLLTPLRLDVDLELDLVSVQPTDQDRVTMTEAVIERAHGANDRRGELVAGVSAAQGRFFSGKHGAADELEALALGALPVLDAADHVGLMHVWAGFQWVFGTRGRFEEWGRAAEQALFHSRQAGRADFFHGLTGALIAGPRPADEAAQTLEITLGDHHNLVSAKAYLLAMLGHFDEAWTMATAANRQYREMTGKKRNTDTLGDIAGLAGDYEEAARQHRLYCDSLEEAGRLNILSTHGPILGRYLALLGRYEEAEPLAQLGRELGDEEDVVTQAFWRQVQALVLTHCGEHEEAERLAREAVARIEQTDALNFQGDALCDLATVLEQAGRAEEARAVLEEALTRYERKKNVAMVAQVRQRFGASEDAVRLV